MKKFSKKATKRGYQIIFSIGNLMINKLPRLDRRYNLNKEILLFVRINQLSHIEKKEILAVKKSRAIAKSMCTYVPIRQNKLYVDYRNNRNNIKYIDDDCIHFSSGRNHWAKNDRDLKVINILKRHFAKK